MQILICWIHYHHLQGWGRGGGAQGEFDFEGGNIATFPRAPCEELTLCQSMSSSLGFRSVVLWTHVFDSLKMF